MKTTYWQDCSVAYKDELLNNIMPFWMKHGFDKKNGGSGDTYTAYQRTYSIIPDSKGSGTDALIYTGTIKSAGDMKKGTFNMSTKTFTADGAA